MLSHGGSQACWLEVAAFVLYPSDELLLTIPASGSFLVMVMKMVSLGFDLEEQRGRGGERKPPVLYELPDFIDYTSYCVFPATTIFGPFVTFDEHCKFLRPSPLVSW